MESLSFRCPNCGALIDITNSQLKCPRCHTSILELVDIEFDPTITRMASEDLVPIFEAVAEKYPDNYINWINLANIKRDIKPNYNGDKEFAEMCKCEGFSEKEIPEWIKKRYGIGYSLRETLKERFGAIGSVLLAVLPLLFSFGGLIVLAALPDLGIIILSVVVIGLAGAICIPISTAIVKKRRISQLRRGKVPADTQNKAILLRLVLIILYGGYAYLIYVNWQAVLVRLHWVVILVIGLVLFVAITTSIIGAILYYLTCYRPKILFKVKMVGSLIISIIATIICSILFVSGMIALSNGTYHIKNTDDFNLFVNAPNADCSTYILDNDIDFEGKNCDTWGAIVNFSGTFDGNYHTIKNLHFEGTAVELGHAANRGSMGNTYGMGLFGNNLGVIKNLTVENCEMVVTDLAKSNRNYTNEYQFAGILAAVNYGTIENCRLYNNDIYFTNGEYNCYYGVGAVAGANSVYQIDPGCSVWAEDNWQIGTIKDIECYSDEMPTIIEWNIYYNADIAEPLLEDCVTADRTTYEIYNKTYDWVNSDNDYPTPCTGF